MSAPTKKSGHNSNTSRTRGLQELVHQPGYASLEGNAKDWKENSFLSIDLKTSPRLTQPQIHSPMIFQKRGDIKNPQLSAYSYRHTESYPAATPCLSSNHISSASVDLFKRDSFNSPVRQPTLPNLRVKMPFKHAVGKKTMTTSSIFPGQTLIEATALAIHVANKILTQDRPSRTVCINGRLLKARLKTLHPVPITEPTIFQCRGIISETRLYSACSSRTSERMTTHLIRQTPSPKDAIKQHVSIKERLSESVHRTSVVSSPDLILGTLRSRDCDLYQKVDLNAQGRSED